jgi:hypothetical protein
MGIVDDYVEAGLRTVDFVQQRGEGREIVHVDLIRLGRLRAEFLAPLAGGIVEAIAAAESDDAGAVAEEAAGHGAAKVPGGTGEKDGLAFERKEM